MIFSEFGRLPDRLRLDSAQNPLDSTDFRRLYATVAADWWGVNLDTVTRGFLRRCGF